MHRQQVEAAVITPDHLVRNGGGGGGEPPLRTSAVLTPDDN